MNTLTPNAVLEQLQWRYAVKKFDAAKKLNSDQWGAIENALLLSASSFGLQPWKFLIVQNPSVRKTLTPASWNQTQVEECSHYVVFCAKESIDATYIAKYIESVAATRGVPAASLDGYRKMMEGDLLHGSRSKIIAEWATRQTYIALGTALTTAAVIGVDACPIEGFEPPKYDEILGLKGTGYRSVVCAAFGFRHPDDKYSTAKKVRFSKSEVLKTV